MNQKTKIKCMAPVHASRRTSYTFGIRFIFFPIYLYTVGFDDSKVVTVAKYLSTCELKSLTVY